MYMTKIITYQIPAMCEAWGPMEKILEVRGMIGGNRRKCWQERYIRALVRVEWKNSYCR
jgi:hypothetical protein